MSALSDEMGKDWCIDLLSFYMFTGEDGISAFKGKGKVAPLRKFMKTSRFHASFRYFFIFVLSRTESVEFYKKFFGLVFFCGQDYVLSKSFQSLSPTDREKQLTGNPIAFHTLYIYFGEHLHLQQFVRWSYKKDTFKKLCDDWTIQHSVFEDIKTFTCAMYGYLQEQSVNIVRSKMLKKMVGEDKPLSADSKVDIADLPPCKILLLPHVQWVNYRLCCYRKTHISIFERPKPYDHEQEWLQENNIIVLLQTKVIILSQSGVDLLDSSRDDEEQDDGLKLQNSTDYDDDDDD